MLESLKVADLFKITYFEEHLRMAAPECADELIQILLSVNPNPGYAFNPKPTVVKKKEYMTKPYADGRIKSVLIVNDVEYFSLYVWNCH